MEAQLIPAIQSMETVQKSQLNYQIRYYLSEHFLHLQLVFVISDRKHELVSLFLVKLFA